MIKDIFRSVGLFVITAVLAYLVYLSEKNECNVIGVLLSAVIGWLIEQFIFSVQNITDINSWKKEQRKCQRGHFINKDTIIRISFAYIFRIKIDGKYLLVLNGRNTGKYQPVGGVYKMLDSEKIFLSSKYGCMDDIMIPIDVSSKNDYRLRVKNRYLRKFVRRFNKGVGRETIDNLSREFKEELIDTKILSAEKFKKIKYEYIGRYYNGVKLTQQFGCYELLLGDVVSLIPSNDQQAELEKVLYGELNKNVAFFSDGQISKLGIDTMRGSLEETIADHAVNVLESNFDKLEGGLKRGKEYSVDLN